MILRALVLVTLSLSPALAAVNYSRILDTGSNGTTYISAAAVDAAGNVYLTGSTTSTNFPTTAGVVQPKLAPGLCTMIFDPHSPPLIGPCEDVVVVKMDSLGNIVFATYLGGSGSDTGLAIAVDAQGAIYVAGRTYRTGGSLNDFPTTPGAAFRTESSLIRDAFVTKLNPSGTALVYSTLLPGAGGSSVSLAVDAGGNVYFGGSALPAEGVFETTAGAFQSSAVTGPVEHAVVAKLNPAGSGLVFSTYVAGSGNDYLDGLALDSAGNVYISGTTFSADFPVTAGAFQSVPGNKFYTAFVSKLNPQGSALVYSTLLGGSSSDSGGAIRVDAQGNAVVLGNTNSNDFPTTSGAFLTGTKRPPWSSNNFLSRAFVAKLNPQGSGLVYSTYFDGAGSVDEDASGSATVTGQGSYGFLATAGATQRCAANSADVLAAQLDPRGSVIAASYLGGSDTDSATQGVVGADGSLYVVGLTASPDFPGASFSGTPQVRAVTHSFVSKLRIADPSQVDSPCMARVVQNSASFAEGAVAPGELVTFRGLGMAPDSAFAPGPPVRFGAIQVLFDGVPAPVLYAQSRQINTQVPWELAGHTSTQVHVEYNGVPTNSATLPLAAAAPGLFSRLDGTSQGVILNQDGSLNSPANPAARGSVVAIFGTGGGALSPPGVTGGTWPASLSYFSPQPTVKIGPSDAVVTYAGSAPFQSSGVFQINVRVPDGLSAYSFYYVLLTIGGATNAPGCCVTIAVQ